MCSSSSCLLVTVEVQQGPTKKLSRREGAAFGQANPAKFVEPEGPMMGQNNKKIYQVSQENKLLSNMPQFIPGDS